MPYVTAASDGLTEALSFPFKAREDALLKAIELAEAGKEAISVADIETGEVLTGEELLAAIKELASGSISGGG